jgi:hypothetical protein
VLIAKLHLRALPLPLRARLVPVTPCQVLACQEIPAKQLEWVFASLPLKVPKNNKRPLTVTQNGNKRRRAGLRQETDSLLIGFEFLTGIVCLALSLNHYFELA